jgi:serine/threonine protein kinase
MPIDFTILPDNIANAIRDLEAKYVFKSMNHKGANGHVLVGCNPMLNRKVVVKIYYWGDGAHAEPQTLSSLASSNVLRVEDAAAIDKDNAYFVTPFCEQGDLDDVLCQGKIGLIQALDYLQDIASGASYIHGAGYIHRDLKPSNIFCQNDGKLVIGDFGSVVKIGEQGYAETGSTHSLIYRSPEEIATKRAYPQGDIYQLGIILYQLLGGLLPYDLAGWLKPKELAAYNARLYPENQIYADSVVKGLIVRGKVLDLDRLPAWCPKQLIAVIRKCTKVDRVDRFDSVSALKAELIPTLTDIYP